MDFIRVARRGDDLAGGDDDVGWPESTVSLPDGSRSYDE
jgi:hypothetical protein